MERFTQEKIYLSEMTKYLIEFYYKIKEQNELSANIAKPLEDFIRNITGKTFTYNVKDGSLSLNGRYIISATMKQIEFFKHVMGLLETNKQTYHFGLLSIKDNVDTDFTPIVNLPEEDFADEDGEVDTEKKDPEIQWICMSDINKKIAMAINKQEPQIIDNKAVKIITKSSRLYMVEPISDFAGALIKASPREDPPNQIFPINWLDFKTGNRRPYLINQSWTSFMQIARILLINFYIAFGSFERIKNCLECGNLFFEKKREAGCIAVLYAKRNTGINFLD